MRKTPLLSRSLLGAGLLAASLSAQATVITFDNTALGSFNFIGANGSYSEAGFTVQATGSTSLYTIDPTFNAAYPAQNGTDFGYTTNVARSFTLTESTNAPFALNSLYLATVANQPAGDVILTGNLAAGGTVSQVFTTPGGNAWTPLLTLGAGWTGLASVDFVAASNALGFDSIDVTAAAPAVPVPPSVWLLGAGMLGLLGLRRRRV